MRLVSTVEDSITLLASTKDSNAIHGLSTSKDRVIEGIDGNSKKVDDFGIVDVNKKKTAKSKDLGKTRAIFFIPKASLIFTKLRQVFIKAPILCQSDPEYYIQIKTETLEYAIHRIPS